MSIAESSTIYDKDGKELYKIFKEKRTYVNYEDISKNMINAIIA
jgi:membrane peptidoglycan carboxypeptidase